MIEDKRFAIIGAGMAGGSLAAALAARGAKVAAVASRRLGSAQALAERIGGAFATDDAAAAARRGNAVVLSVPDGAIAAVCQEIALREGFEPGDVAMHLSGALGSDALAAARQRGASALAFHPIQSFARVDPGLFDAIVCTLEGDGEAVALGAELAAFLGAASVELRADDKALYHAALSIACNYLVTLADAGSELLERAGFADAALPALLPLLRGTVENLATVGLPAALTGPIGRGDLATLRAHLAALEARAPGLLPLYRTLGLRTIGVALKKGTIGDEEAREMMRLLGGR